MRSAIVWLGLGVAAASAAPMVHQGRLLDSSGEPMNGLQTVVVNLIEADDDVAFTESHQITFEDGYYAVRIGSIQDLDPGIFDEPLDVQLTIGGQSMGREPLASVPSALSVDGYVRLSGVLAQCSVSTQGALRYEAGRLLLCNGTSWLAIAGRASVRPMTVLANNEMVDEEGNFTFTTTSAIRYDTVANEGSHSLTAAVYGSEGTGTPDWAAQTQSDPQWGLQSELEDWEFVWDQRYTDDNGYGRVLFANTTEWADDHNGWCPSGSTPTKYLSAGWMTCFYWTASRFHFHGTGESVSWPYVGYHLDWKTLSLVKQGDVLEFFIDGSSQGQRTMPSISSSASSVLYLSGSTNGSVLEYDPTEQLTERSQMDNIRFRAR